MGSYDYVCIYDSVMYVTRTTESKHHPLFEEELERVYTFFKITGSSSAQFVSFDKFQFRSRLDNSGFSNDYNN